MGTNPEKETPELSRKEFINLVKFGVNAGLITWLTSTIGRYIDRPTSSEAEEVLARALASGSLLSTYLPLVPKQTACDPEGQVLGVEAWRGSLDERSRRLLEMSKTRRLRTELRWDLVEPVRGQVDWDYLRAVRDELREVKRAVPEIQIWLTVKGAPAFAQSVPGIACSPIKEEEISSFIQFLETISSPEHEYHLPIDAIEFGNEPDVRVDQAPSEPYYGCWVTDHDGDGTITAIDWELSGQDYARVLQAVYSAVKEVNPNLTIIAGALALTDKVNGEAFIKGMADYLSGQRPFDVFTFHAYITYEEGVPPTDPEASPYWGGNSILGKATLIRKYFPNVELVLGETAFKCPPPDTESCGPIAEGRKAAWIMRLILRLIANDIRGFVWYCIKEPEWAGTGLTGTDGEIRPAYITYAFLSCLFCSGMMHEDSYLDEEGFEHHNFSGPQGKQYTFIWRNDGAEINYPLPSDVTSVFDYLGNPQEFTPGEQLPIGYYPFVIVK